jgi:sugar phosphate isomerase/epimerase
MLGALEALPGDVEREELLDLLRERTLRQGLFVRSGGAGRRPPEAPRRPVSEGAAGLESVPFSAGCPASPRPRASALARLQAAEGARVTSLRHQNVTLDPLAAEVLLLLDGTRRVEEVAAACGEPTVVVEAVIERLRGDALLEG